MSREEALREGPADVLLRAADLIEERGWWRAGEDYGDGQSAAPTCAVLAIEEVAPSRAVEMEAKHQLKRSLGFHEAYWRLDLWNDAQPNAEAVTSKMRDAARALLAKEESPNG